MNRSVMEPLRTPAAVLALTFFLAACGSSDSPTEPCTQDAAVVAAAVQSSVPVPPQGAATTLDVGNWNVEWFGSPTNGPSNDALQLDNVATVLAGADLDVWGLEEIADDAAFASLLSQLSGYSGMLANDPFVTNGPAYYSDFGDKEQKVALVYRTDEVRLDSARVILTDRDYEFAGRPPVAFDLTVTVNGETERLVVVVMHAKAGDTAADRDRRDAAALALKDYLDARYPTEKVLIVGDFNDDVDTSIVSGQPSPYRYFVQDAADYTFPTEALSDAGSRSTVRYAEMIDHQLATDEMFATYVPGSVEAFRADQYVTDYGNTTSDHYPVIARYTVTADGSVPNAAPSARFTLSCSGLTCTFDGSGSTDPDGDTLDYDWTFGDGASATGANPAHTYGASGSYGVTLTVTDPVGAQASVAQTVAVKGVAGCS